MEQFGLEMILFLVGAGFLAAFIDSVVGGGGLIALPALLLTGISPTLALGTNKLGGTMCSLTSTATFLASRKVNMRVVFTLFPLSLLGSIIGTLLVRQIPSDFLRPLIVVLLIAVTLYTLLKKDWGTVSTFKGMTRQSSVWMAIGSLTIGIYDGFFGPGTGSFLIFLFLFLGFDFVGASANAKVLNLASNVGSLATFLFFGSVHFIYGLPLGIAMIAGAIIGSRVAIRKGSSYVKPLFVLITSLFIGKQLWTMLFS